MTIEHKDIPDTDRHEPKGIASAADKLVYVSNGAGSGSWSQRFQNIAPYAEIDSAEQIISLTGSSAIKLGSFVFDDYDSTKFTLTGGNKLTVLENGLYYVTWGFRFKPQSALGGTSEVLETTLTTNGLLPTPSRTASLTITRNSSIDDPFEMSVHRIIDIPTNGYFEVFVKNLAATRSYKVSAFLNMFKFRNL